MVDSRAKGARGEYLVRNLLRLKSGLKFERVPASGALAYLKGDLYIPHENCRYCIEVKNYKESALTDKILTNKTNHIVIWWTKLLEQAALREQEPLLFFKYDRSKLFVATDKEPKIKYIYINWLGCYITIAEEWLDSEKIEWLKPS